MSTSHTTQQGPIIEKEKRAFCGGLDKTIIKRQKQELQALKKRLNQLEQSTFRTKPSQEKRREPIPFAEEEFAQETPRKAEETKKESPAKDADNLFSKVFSKPVMERLLNSQISRQAGELAAGLALSPEQQQEVEDLLKRLNPKLQGQAPSKSSDLEEGDSAPAKTLEEGLKDILSQEQYQEYQEYTNKKKALNKASPMEKKLFEISWRLKLNEEQKTQTREILQDQQEKTLALIQARRQDTDLSPIEQLEQYIEKKEVLTRETATKMETVLTEDQFNDFLLYQEQSNMERQFLQELIAEEKDAGEE